MSESRHAEGVRLDSLRRSADAAERQASSMRRRASAEERIATALERLVQLLESCADRQPEASGEAGTVTRSAGSEETT